MGVPVFSGLPQTATRKLLKTKNGVRRARSVRGRPALQPALQASRLRALRARRTPCFGFEEFASHEQVNKDLATPKWLDENASDIMTNKQQKQGYVFALLQCLPTFPGGLSAGHLSISLPVSDKDYLRPTRHYHRSGLQLIKTYAAER